MKPQYLELIPTTVAGIPCQIGVTDIDKDSCDWEIVDRKGYHATWLESKLTMKDEFNITKTSLQLLRVGIMNGKLTGANINSKAGIGETK